MRDTWDEAMVLAGVTFKEGAEVNARTNANGVTLSERRKLYSLDKLLKHRIKEKLEEIQRLESRSISSNDAELLAQKRKRRSRLRAPRGAKHHESGEQRIWGLKRRQDFDPAIVLGLERYAGGGSHCLVCEATRLLRALFRIDRWLELFGKQRRRQREDTWDEAMVRAGVKFKEGAEVNAHTNRITLSPLEAAALKRAEEKGVKLKAGVEIQVAARSRSHPNPGIGNRAGAAVPTT
ncbi:MAG: hypothetical protein U5O39_00370 [Gammaproteobacteria bacterium]|nr:hypothetical protein [Gammaproteobacteria bacterium]